MESKLIICKYMHRKVIQLIFKNKNEKKRILGTGAKARI